MAVFRHPLFFGSPIGTARAAYAAALTLGLASCTPNPSGTPPDEQDPSAQEPSASPSGGQPTTQTPSDSSTQENESSSPLPDTDSPESSESSQAPGSGTIEHIEIDIGDMTFNARVAGPKGGDPVILLHGFPQTSLEWTEQLKELGLAGFRALAPDQRGYSPGARPTGLDAYRTQKLVADLLALAKARNFSRFHLVGHDWGAAVAWAFAAAHPKMLASLTAVSVPHPDAFSEQLKDKCSCQYEASSYFDLFIQPNFEDTLLAFNATGLRNSYEGLPPDRIQAYVDTLGTKPALGAGLNWYRANIKDRQTVDPPTGSIQVPTLLIWSDKDKAICKEGPEQTHKYVDAPYELVVLKGVNHWVPELAPEAVSKQLLAHFKAHPI